MGAEIDVAAMDEFLQKAYHANRELRSSEGTEGGTYTHTELALTGFLNNYAGGGHILFVDRAFIHKSRPVTVLSAPKDGRQVYIQISRDTRTILMSKRAIKDYLRDTDVQTRPVLDSLVRYYNTKEVKATLGAGTVHAVTQEPCIALVVAPGHPVLTQLVSAWGSAKPIDVSDLEASAEA
jgi:hypothetical protein